MTARDRKVADIEDAKSRDAADPAVPGSKEEAEGLESGGIVPELARRIVAAGLQSFFSTEEVLRKAVGDTLPQDWIDFASDQSTRTQAEFLDRLAREIGRVLEQTDPADMLARLLEGREVEVRATFRLRPSEDGSPGFELKSEPRK